MSGSPLSVWRRSTSAALRCPQRTCRFPARPCSSSLFSIAIFSKAAACASRSTRRTGILSGSVTSRSLALLGEILALQIEGIDQIQNETQVSPEPTGLTPAQREADATREAVQFLFATDQTLRSGVQVGFTDGSLTLQGEVSSVAQKNWAEQIGQAVSGDIKSRLKVSDSTTFPVPHMAEPPPLDDESLQALVLFRLRLVRETEHLPLRVKANRGIVTVQGKVAATKPCVSAWKISRVPRSACANCAARSLIAS